MGEGLKSRLQDAALSELPGPEGNGLTGYARAAELWPASLPRSRAGFLFLFLQEAKISIFLPQAQS